MLKYESFYRQHIQRAWVSNEQLYGCCPFHDDKNPSFSANLQTGLCQCFSEICGFQGNAQIFAEKLGIELPETLKYPPLAQQKKVRIIRNKVVAEYLYFDEAGQILYKKLRYDPKGFSLKRPDGNDGWIDGIEGVRRVLYNLPQVIAAQQVIIVEGEKDVEKLRDAGFIATTNPMGASESFDQYSKPFKSKDVIVIPDNDDAGRKHAEKVIQSIKGIARTINLITLPEEVGEGGDVSDYFDKLKKTPEELSRLINSIPLISTVLSEGIEERIPEEKEIFPDIYGGVAWDFADLYSEYLEPPKHFFYMSFLTVLGILLADKLTLKGELKEQPRLYLILLGASGDTRKSTAIDKTVLFFKESMLYLSEELSISTGLGSAEGLQHRLDNQKNIKDPKKLLLCFDEFKAFLNKCTISSSVLLQCVNSLFHKNEYENHTKTTNISLKDVFVSMLSASTINTYKNAWSPTFTDIGFNNRLFIVPGGCKKKYSIPEEIPQDRKNQIKIKLANIFQLCENQQLELEMTQEAKELYDEWYHNLEPSIHSKRLDTYAMRLMPLLSVNELKTVVDIEIVNKVIAICDWQYQMRILYDPIDADNEIAKMEERVRRQLTAKGPMKERDLKKALHTERKQHGIWTYSKAIENLSKSQEIVRNGQGEWELNDES